MKRDAIRQKISAFIVCFNEEAVIKRCLEAIKWCDEIVVVDSGSTDSTLEICKEYTNKVFHRDWSGYVEQKEFGLNKCSNEWVLNVDADEEVSPELTDEIMGLLEENQDEISGYYISRVTYFLGRWWRNGSWYPEYRLRLVRKSRTVWAGEDPHEKAIVEGPTLQTKGELFHYTYNDIFDQIERLNKFSTTAALGLYRKGEKSSIIGMIFNPIFRFLKSFVFKRGFLAGKAGLIVAINEAHYVFLKYAKLWEAEQDKDNDASTSF